VNSGVLPSAVIRWLTSAVAALAFVFSSRAAERINQEGRILGPLLVVTNSILFDTAQADAVVASMQIFPVTSAYNEDVSRLPLATNSSKIIAQISSDLSASRQTLRLFQEMNYVLAPDSQPLVPINFVDYPDQSDLNGGTYPYGLYPIPTNMPIEGWPSQTGDETLLASESDTNGIGSTDRHGIIVQPGAGLSFETWETFLFTNDWQAANGAIFDLNSNAQRPDGWTSGDAAGLSMFGPLVRFDECERGMVEHACRLVVKRSLYNSYFYPATHYASTNTLPNLPSMGQRLRLKASFAVPANWTIEEKAVLAGLKKYGALVADNGGFFSISIAPDDRWPDNAFDDFSSPGVNLTNFEVVQSTGPTEGPRSPGAPVASAGSNYSVTVSQPIQLQGYVAYAGAKPAILWKLYSGPGTTSNPITFADATQTNTIVTFNHGGIYTLELSAADGVHAVAYDAVVITVTGGFSLLGSLSGTNINLTWTGGTAPFVVQRADEFPPTTWTSILTTSAQTASFPAINTASYFRVKSN
jgi:hypothetical protein